MNHEPAPGTTNEQSAVEFDDITRAFLDSLHGKQLNIQRSNGNIDGGWQLIDESPVAHKGMLYVQVVKGESSKLVPVSSLKELNPSEVEVDGDTIPRAAIVQIGDAAVAEVVEAPDATAVEAIGAPDQSAEHLSNLKNGIMSDIYTMDDIARHGDLGYFSQYIEVFGHKITELRTIEPDSLLAAKLDQELEALRSQVRLDMYSGQMSAGAYKEILDRITVHVSAN